MNGERERDKYVCMYVYTIQSSRIDYPASQITKISIANAEKASTPASNVVIKHWP